MIARRTIIGLAVATAASLPLGGEAWPAYSPGDCIVGYVAAMDPPPRTVRIARRGVPEAAPDAAYAAPPLGTYVRIGDEIHITGHGLLIYMVFAWDGTTRHRKIGWAPGQTCPAEGCALRQPLDEGYADCSPGSQALRSGLRRRLLTNVLFERPANTLPAQLASRVWVKQGRR